MAWALVANTGVGGPANAAVTPAINTTGANLIVLNVAWYNGVTPSGTLSDSKGNTWTALTAQAGTGTNLVTSQLFYAYNPTVGTGHTFTYTAAGAFPAVEVQAWSGSASTPFDVQNGALANSVTTLNTGSITPTVSGELLVSGLAVESGAGAISINSGFTISNTNPYTASTSEGGSMAYLVQVTAAAINPQWNTTTASGNGLAVTIASFKVAGGATHTTTGAVVGSGAIVAGTATHLTLHTTTGAAVGAGTVVVGSAAHVHATTGVVVGSGAVVVGAATHTAAGTHATSGAVVGSGSTVAGTSTRLAFHTTTGTVVGVNPVVAGSALRTPALVTHTTTGAVVGVGPRVQGFASGPATMQVTVGGWIERKKPDPVAKPKTTLKLPAKAAVAKAMPEAELATLREELAQLKLAKRDKRRRAELALVLR